MLPLAWVPLVPLVPEPFDEAGVAPLTATAPGMSGLVPVNVDGDVVVGVVGVGIEPCAPWPLVPVTGLLTPVGRVGEAAEPFAPPLPTGTVIEALEGSLEVLFSQIGLVAGRVNLGAGAGARRS